MNEERSAVRIAVRIDDPRLADRIVSVLGGVAGVRLVREDEPADAVVIGPPETAMIAGDAFDATNAARMRTSDGDHSLTPREREVLALLAEGASNKTIAKRLGISVHTAKFHVGSLLDKLDAAGRTDAVMHALRLGAIDL